MRRKHFLHGFILGLALGVAFGALGVAFAQAMVPSDPSLTLPNLTLPNLPANAKLVETGAIQCPEGVLGVAGYDVNGNGDWEIAEVWRAGVRVAVVYFALPAEEDIADAYVVEGALVVRYAKGEFLARYGSLCDLGATTGPGTQT